MAHLTLEGSTQAFRHKFVKSGRLAEDARGAIPGGYSRSTFNFGPHAVYVESGEGCRIRTVEGHDLLDLNNNYTVNVLGHGHPAITAALASGAAGGISFGNPTVHEVELARILIDRIPSIEMVQFSCSATESCMAAVRVARAATGRTKIAKLEGGYHGFSDTLYVSAHSQPGQDVGPDEAPNAIAGSGGIPQVDVDNIVVLPQNDGAAAEQILTDQARDIACLIIELQSGSGGLVTLDRDYVEHLREITARHGIVLIFDETITLRAGYHGMQGVYGVMPDLTVMGKMVGGGLPLGALGGARNLMRLLGDGAVSVSGTHHGHKLAVIAGAACLTAMDETAFARLNGLADRLVRRVNDWAAGNGSALSMFGGGFSHLGYAYLRQPGLAIRSHRDYWRNVDTERTQICSLELANRGFFPVHRGEISLSTPMTEGDVDTFADALTGIAAELGP